MTSAADRIEHDGRSDDSKPEWDTVALPEGEAKVRAVRAMFDEIAPRYDLVNRIMTFRLDVRWRRLAVRKLRLAKTSTVLDLASGTGDLCVDLRRAGLQPLSVDLSFGMLAATARGLLAVKQTFFVSRSRTQVSMA